MDNPYQPEPPEVHKRLHQLFRDYFDRAEKKRRWSIRDDIPWNQCNPSLNPAIADVVETFCAVELYLPDYLSKSMPQVRTVRGRAWFIANWGYEEAKHSMVLGDWLLRSKLRTEEQMTDLENEVFAHEYQVPFGHGRGMLCYAVLQELATWLHYHNLRERLSAEGGDPALERILTLVSVDERAHYDFFRRATAIYLEYDYEGTIEALRRVVNTFDMPAVNLLSDSRKRSEAVQRLRIFDLDIFFDKVLEPALQGLGLTRASLRRRARREFMPPAGVNV
jgi:acyl-[acyl-carrier-protein] desaturase